MGICSGISTKWLFIHCFLIDLEFRSVDFCGWTKTGEPGEPGEKPSEQAREPTTNSIHIWRRARESNLATLVEGERSHHCAIPAPTGSGREAPDPAFPLLFHENSATRTVFCHYPEFQKNTFKSVISTKAKKQIVDWPFQSIFWIYGAFLKGSCKKEIALCTAQYDERARFIT